MQKQSSFFSYYKSKNEESQPCAVEGCENSGSHTVLLNPKNPRDRAHMCLDHAQVHNKKLDYFKNMERHEIENEIKKDTVWRLPTWPLRGDYRRLFIHSSVESFYGRPMEKPAAASAVVFPPEIEEAANVMGITLPITLSALKKTYKEKVKQNHPDLNQNKQGAEEELKKINIAYKTLCDYLKDA